MWSVKITVEENEVFRPSEIIADLRTVAETLFHPMRLVGFWDDHADGMHLCPQESAGKTCPHKLPKDNPDYVDYATTISRGMGAVLHVAFPHAKVNLYLK